MLSAGHTNGFPVASLTVRQIDDSLKRELRLRAAKNGRSMEDEVRVLLRAAASEPPGVDVQSATPTRRGRANELLSAVSRVLVIIGGGIAAYKSLDLIRRLKERGLHVRCILTKAAQEFIT